MSPHERRCGLRGAVVLLAVAVSMPSAVLADTDSTLDQIDRAVRTRFYAPDVLVRIDWSARVAQTGRRLAQPTTPAARQALLGELVESLGASHTRYYPRSVPEYWDLLSIFEPALPHLAEQCPELASLPPRPITREEIGVFWRHIGTRWFVAGVLDQGPAQAAGLLVGDEVVRANGKPFDPGASLSGRTGQMVKLDVRRRPGGPLLIVEVIPRIAAPVTAYREAMTASARVIERNGVRIGYIHVWSWTGEAMSQALHEAIGELNERKPTGFILDIRDGWGGAPPSELNLFDRDGRVPVLQTRQRDGKVILFDPQIRGPVVILINGGVRSGKEVIAWGAKHRNLARLVGERTAGAVLAGTPFCLDDGALLFLAVGEVKVDGEVLEGRGVEPDIPVPFDIRYAQGRDPQLDRAIELLAPATVP